MKRIISVIIASVIIFSAFSVFAGGENDYKGYPVVLVPGYASASLCYEEDGEVHTAWGWELDDILPPIIENIPGVTKGISDFIHTGDNDNLIDSVADCLLGLLEPMACNPDGSSVKKVRPVLVSAEKTCDEYMNRVYPDGDYRVELDMTKELDSLVGEENVFYFNCDFRMSAVDCAADLDRYIEDVIKYTGSDKVNIVAVSHGGLITSTYLALYMEKEQVFNVVMDEPALAGAGIAADLLKGEIDFDEETMVKYLEYHSVCETDINMLVRAHQLGFVDGVLEELLPKVRKGVMYWNSIWDFISPDDYEELKGKYLDSQQNGELIRKTDYVHYSVMANYREIFKSAQDRGIRVNIIAGSGNRILSGQNDIADGIITVKSSTGAYCAPFGKRFSDGYVHNAYENGRIISPSMDIDITDGYLPENTWIVRGLFHGMEFWDEYSRNLLFKLLLTDEPVDVNTSGEFPQFRDTTSATSDIYFSFNKSKPGFLGNEDTELVIKNCSEKYDAYILSVTAQGAELDFSLGDVTFIRAGESESVSFSGKIPAGITCGEITVNYIMKGSWTPLDCRRQTFTLINKADEKAQYDDSEDFVDSSFSTSFEDKCSGFSESIVRKTGTQDIVNIIADTDRKRFIKYFMMK